MIALTSRLLPLALLAALAVPVAFADQPQAAAPVPASQQPDQRPLLWKVSDADNSVYLLGSFHLLKQEDYPLPKDIDAAFEDAEALVFEVDPREMTAPAAMETIQKYAAYAPGKSLSTVLPKATYDKLGNLVSASGGSVQALEQSEPWMVSMSLVLGITNAMGFKSELGLDRHLMARAAAAGKPVYGLETIEDQMRAIDSVSHAEQAQGLQEFLDDPQQAVRQMQDLHGWWRSGDVAKLDSEMRAEMAKKSPESYRLLDVDRNNAWLPKVEARLKESKADDTLVVVGTLHLLGEDGLVEKLSAKGYSVERMCETCD
jgi:uncharacterized protein YbaP (TraB family)